MKEEVVETEEVVVVETGEDKKKATIRRLVDTSYEI
jgi:hypothetical protein